MAVTQLLSDRKLHLLLPFGFYATSNPAYIDHQFATSDKKSELHHGLLLGLKYLAFVRVYVTFNHKIL